MTLKEMRIAALKHHAKKVAECRDTQAQLYRYRSQMSDDEYNNLYNGINEDISKMEDYTNDFLKKHNLKPL